MRSGAMVRRSSRLVNPIPVYGSSRWFESLCAHRLTGETSPIGPPAEGTGLRTGLRVEEVANGSARRMTQVSGQVVPFPAAVLGVVDYADQSLQRSSQSGLTLEAIRSNRRSCRLSAICVASEVNTAVGARPAISCPTTGVGWEHVESGARRSARGEFCGRSVD
jgi:hypothetical protein